MQTLNLQFNPDNGTPLISIPGYGAIWCIGSAKPTDGTAGYGKGCLFIDNDGGVGSTLFVNEG